jgi:putative hydrolase of the HAD superfamily
MSAIIVFDADNTLWDTNAVFREAQIDLLSVFAEAGLLKNPKAALDTLRKIDRALVRLTGQFEYDFTFLARAVGHYYSGIINVEQAADFALKQIESVSASVIEKSSAAFAQTLEEIPPLFGDTEEVLRCLTGTRSLQGSSVLILFTDGERLRIERILETYKLAESTFDEVVIGRKTAESFNEVRLLGLDKLKSVGRSEAKLLMIGDSLKHDIAPSKQAGFTTIYKPADFLGAEAPTNSDELPDFRIDSLGELADVLERMGLLLHSNAHKYANKTAAGISNRS